MAKGNGRAYIRAKICIPGLKTLNLSGLENLLH
jgi:hypothetical protein